MTIDIITAGCITLFLLWLGGVAPAFTFAILAVLIEVTDHYSRRRP